MMDDHHHHGHGHHGHGNHHDSHDKHHDHRHKFLGYEMPSHGDDLTVIAHKVIERNKRLHITHLIVRNHVEEGKKIFLSRYGFTWVEGVRGSMGDDLKGKVHQMRYSLKVKKDRMKKKGEDYFKGK